MRVLVIMDPIERINLKKDSTMAMLWAASRRGHQLGYALQSDLFIDHGKALARLRRYKCLRIPLTFIGSVNKKSNRWPVMM